MSASQLYSIFLADSRISIVEDTPGVTRDRLYAEAEWLDRRFMMVDTGGIEIANTDSIAVSIREQAKIAIKEADVHPLCPVTPVQGLRQKTKKWPN